MSDINRASGRRVGWYSGVWCCMVKQGVVYCGVNVLWYGMVQASMVWFGMVRRLVQWGVYCVVLWYGMVHMVWYGSVCGMVRYDGG